MGRRDRAVTSAEVRSVSEMWRGGIGVP